jgi:uncharacterized membrane protein
MSESKIILYLKILACVGLALSIYLLSQQIFKPEFRPCTINATVNCDAVIDGPVARTLGIPTPLYGLFGYLFILYGALKNNKKLILGMTTFGLAFCAYIGYVELVQLRVICPVCIGCQLVMLTSFILAVVLSRKNGDKS